MAVNLAAPYPRPQLKKHCKIHVKPAAGTVQIPLTMLLKMSMLRVHGPLEEAWFLHKARHTEAHDSGPWAIACSGGVDSVALLKLAATLEQGRELAVFHVHHGQHDRADDQEECVRALSESFNFPFFSARLALSSGESEHVLRQERFKAFEELWHHWQGPGAPARLVLAHHRDDQAETALLRLIRGMSPQSPGLIQPVSRVGGLTLLRPLLTVPKNALIAFAAAHALTWVEDPTNSDHAHVRNAIRGQVLPMLERLRPGSSAKIAGFFTELQEAHEEEAGRVSLSPEETELGNFRLEEISFNFLKARVEECLGEGRGRVTRSHWNVLMKTVSSGTTDGSRKAVEFPGGVSVIIHKKRVTIAMGRPAQ
jgi:tRNA(Ile)-lysidine synthetase-like protein